LMPRDPPAAPGESVAFLRLLSGRYLVTESADRNVYEQFRRLKRPLLRCAFGPLAETGTQVVMITSALQGAGKTFVAGNLAHVLAMEKDRSVLLIDTDNANPTLTRQLGLLGRPGLFDVINDAGMTLEQAICRTDVPGLYVLPAGRSAPDSLERLNSDRCREVLEEILSNHPGGIVILDAPPLLVTSDAPAVAGLAGQFLMVVEAGETSRSSVCKALELLDERKPIGLILNRAPGHGDPGSYYAYPAQSGPA